MDYFSEKIIAGPHGVPDPPSVTLTFTSSSTISAGETAELECIANAYPTNLTYMWTVDGRKMEGKDGSTLRLEHLGPEADGSIVICQVLSIHTVSVFNCSTLPRASFHFIHIFGSC